MWLTENETNENKFFFLINFPADCDCGCVDSTIVASTSGPISAPSNGSKTAHTKVVTSGGQAPSKRSSSGADGDYQLVQHEVLYSLSAEYEVIVFNLFSCLNQLIIKKTTNSNWLISCVILACMCLHTDSGY